MATQRAAASASTDGERMNSRRTQIIGAWVATGAAGLLALSGCASPAEHGSNGVVNRPMVEVFVANSSVETDFLVDTGADVTVFRRVTLDALGPESLPTEAVGAHGIGGAAGLVALDTYIEFVDEQQKRARVSGRLHATLDPDAIDFDLLGRDVLNNFEVLLSHRRREVLLLAPPHEYQVTQRQ